MKQVKTDFAVPKLRAYSQHKVYTEDVDRHRDEEVDDGERKEHAPPRRRLSLVVDLHPKV
jgi:hypothetical protein